MIIKIKYKKYLFYILITNMSFSLAATYESSSIRKGQENVAASTRFFDSNSQLCFPGRNTTDTGIIGVAHDSILSESAGCNSAGNRIETYNQVVVPSCVLGGKLCFKSKDSNEGFYDTMLGNRFEGSRPITQSYDQTLKQRAAQFSSVHSGGNKIPLEQCVQQKDRSCY